MERGAVWAASSRGRRPCESGRFGSAPWERNQETKGGWGRMCLDLGLEGERVRSLFYRRGDKKVFWGTKSGK